MSETQHLVKAQTELNEVKVVMKDNIEKVIQRDEQLDDLKAKSEHLRNGAQRFSIKAKKLRNKMWWQDKKTLCILISVIIFILLVIIIPVTIMASK